MAFPMMPGAQFDIVRKMGPDELNKAAMGEYLPQGISPIFALTRIKEEEALTAAFEAKEQKAQQEELAKMQGVPVEEAPVTILEATLKDRGVVGVDPSADQQLTPEETDALQSGIAGGPTPGGEQTYESWIESNPDAPDLSPEAFARSSREEVPARAMMAGGGLIPGYHVGGMIGTTNVPDMHAHGVGVVNGVKMHLENETPHPNWKPAPTATRRVNVQKLQDDWDEGIMSQAGVDINLYDQSSLDTYNARDMQSGRPQGQGTVLAPDSIEVPSVIQEIDYTDALDMTGTPAMQTVNRPDLEIREGLQAGLSRTPSADADADADAMSLDDLVAQVGGSVLSGDPYESRPLGDMSITDETLLRDANTQQLREIASDGTIYSKTLEDIEKARGIQGELDAVTVERGAQKDRGIAAIKGTLGQRTQDATMQSNRARGDRRFAAAMADEQKGRLDTIEGDRDATFATQRATLMDEMGIRDAGAEGREATYRGEMERRDAGALEREADLEQIMEERDTSSAHARDIARGLFEERRGLSETQLAALQRSASLRADSALFGGLGELAMNPYGANQSFTDVLDKVGTIRNTELTDVFGIQNTLATGKEKMEKEVADSLAKMYEDRGTTTGSIHDIQEGTDDDRTTTFDSIRSIQEGTDDDRTTTFDYIHSGEQSQMALRAAAELARRGIETADQAARVAESTNLAEIQTALTDHMQVSDTEIMAIGTDFLNNKSVDLRLKAQIESALNSSNTEALRSLLASQDAFGAFQLKQREEAAKRPAEDRAQYMAMMRDDDEFYSISDEMSDPGNVANLESHVKHLRTRINNYDFSVDNEGNAVDTLDQAKMKQALVRQLDRQSLNTATAQYNYWSSEAAKLGELGPRQITQRKRELLVIAQENMIAFEQARDRLEKTVKENDKRIVSMQGRFRDQNAGILGLGREEGDPMSVDVPPMQGRSRIATSNHPLYGGP